MKATAIGGKLNPITKCTITIPSGPTITLKALPEIDDQKEANYEQEEGIGRTQPYLTYKNSGFRKISMTLHFAVTDESDVDTIWGYIRALQSTVYPNGGGSSGAPYEPPAICKLQCGKIFKDVNGDYVCAVCTSVGVKYPTEPAWDEETYLPWKVDVSTSWQIVYSPNDLPGADKILALGN